MIDQSWRCGIPKLIDRADGVRGHYCIGRSVDMLSHPSIFEFWNDAHGWCSAGTVYVGEQAAKAKLYEVTIP